MARRVLFLMHIDWYWIKQRPQFLAEQLSINNSVLVLYRLNPFRKQLVKFDSSILKYPFLPIPVRFFGYLDKYVQKVWLSVIALFFRPQVIWLTFPDLLEYLPKKLQSLPIVYDCMDYAPGFFEDGNRRISIQRLENKLAGLADIIVCSSECLHRILKEKHPDKKIILLRNAISLDFLDKANNDYSTVRILKRVRRLDVGYWGTISHWLDYDSLLYCLNQIPRLKIHLVGVLETALPVRHERLIIHPPVPHQELFDYSKRFHAFILPFKPTTLIQSVDPVKLYEYIVMGKEVVAVRYAEIERFSPYIHFYENKEMLVSLLERILSGQVKFKNNPGKSIEFLEGNTWESRMKLVDKVLEDITVP